MPPPNTLRIRQVVAKPKTKPAKGNKAAIRVVKRGK